MSRVEPFDYRLAPEDIAPFFRVAGAPGGLLFLDSSRTSERAGRYSYLAIDPSLVLLEEGGVTTLRPGFGAGGVSHAFECDPLDICAVVLEGASEGISARDEGGGSPDVLPPFRGGWAGYIGYDFGASIHGIMPRVHDQSIPRIQLAWYDGVLAWDHMLRTAWIIIRDTRPAFESVAVAGRALAAGEVAQGIRRVPANTGRIMERMRSALASSARGEEAPVRAPARATADAPAPRISGETVTGWPAVVRSSFSRADYMNAVQNVRELILKGDIFQANISQRFTIASRDDSWSLYSRVREGNRSPYSTYFETPSAAVLSASPEMFLSVDAAGFVETRPIKGTRPRGESEGEDETLALELLNSGKDRAENLMIVDLLRNDLSRVCRPGSVFVASLCALEKWATVQHLVSSVRGQLRDGCGVMNLFRATFPGGSITGAPKTRAMQVITGIEGMARGVYCGSIGYFAADGGALLNIAIRTITLTRGLATFSAGGGIVLDSDPESEYEETLAKASGLMAALSSGSGVLQPARE